MVFVAALERQFGGEAFVGLREKRQVLCSSCDTLGLRCPWGSEMDGGPVTSWISLVRQSFPLLGRVKTLIRETETCVELVNFVIMSLCALHRSRICIW